MAVNFESSGHNPGEVIVGDLPSIEVDSETETESESESDDDDDECPGTSRPETTVSLDDSRIYKDGKSISINDPKISKDNTLSTLSNIHTGLESSFAPVFGSVSISSSENVNFGNCTYFNGPVTIKQVIQTSSGIENDAYVKTEEEISPDKKDICNEEPLPVQRFKIQTWHKLVLTVICVSIIGGIWAIIVISLGTKTEDVPDNKNSDGDTSTQNAKVVVIYENYQVVLISIILAPLTFLLINWALLTKEYMKDKKINKEIHSNGSKIGVATKTHLNSSISENNNVEEDEATILIARTHLRIVSRTDWLAQPVEKPLDVIRHPIPWVIITHTATSSCFNQSACVLNVRLIQTFHIESRGWFDIGYNFLVGGDGSAYYGRGWDKVGAHTKGYNKYSISIAFIGTFNNDSPPKQQVEACKKLIRQGVELGKLATDYKLFAHRQLMSTLSPGDKVYDIIKEWPHFVKNSTDIEQLIPNY